jgi:hypothetical protein
MKHWKAYIKVVVPDNLVRQFETTVAADTEYEAVNKFKEKYGQNCIIGWIQETKLYGLQSAGY